MQGWYNYKVWYLYHTINMRGRISWHAIAKDGSIPALQQDAQPSPKVPHSFPLLLPCLACQSCSQLPHLPHCCRVPAAEGLHGQGEEGDAHCSQNLQGPSSLEIGTQLFMKQGPNRDPWQPKQGPKTTIYEIERPKQRQESKFANSVTQNQYL